VLSPGEPSNPTLASIEATRLIWVRLEPRKRTQYDLKSLPCLDLRQGSIWLRSRHSQLFHARPVLRSCGFRGFDLSDSPTLGLALGPARAAPVGLICPIRQLSVSPSVWPGAGPWVCFVDSPPLGLALGLVRRGPVGLFCRIPPTPRSRQGHRRWRGPAGSVTRPAIGFDRDPPNAANLIEVHCITGPAPETNLASIARFQCFFKRPAGRFCPLSMPRPPCRTQATGALNHPPSCQRATSAR